MLKWILGFLLGCCSIFWLSEPLSVFGWISIIALIAFSLAVTGRFGDESPIFQAINQCLMGFCIGLLWLQLHCELRLQQRITEPLTQSHIIKAKLLSIPQVYDDLLQFKVKVLSSEQQLLRGKQLKLSWYQYPEQIAAPNEIPKLGETWQFRVTVKPIVAALNNAGYDAERQSFLDKLAAKGTIKAGSAFKISKASKFSIHALRQALYKELNYLDNAGIFQALIIGEKSAITAEQRLSIQALGVSHLLAISGLHISIIAGLFFWLGLKAALRVNRRRFVITPLLSAAVLSVIAAFIYTALAGFSIATVRALIMWLVFVIALVSANEKAIFRSLAIALLVILLLDPVSVLSYGFWLTFAAIGIIASVLIGRVFSNSKIILAIKVQWVISLGMALLVVSMFQQLSLISFLVNLVLIPIFSLFILPIIFIAVLINLTFYSDLLLSWIDIGIEKFFVLFNADWIKQFGLFVDAYMSSIVYLLLVIAFVCYLLPLGRLRWLPLMALIIMAIGLHKIPEKDSEYKLVVFDVGHGLANLIYNDRVAILYDTGFANEGFSYAEASLIPSLRALGVDSLDILIVSHNDLDHAGGFKAINNAFPVTKLIDVDSCQDQEKIIFPELQLNVYQSDNIQQLKSNNQSCVVQVIADKNLALLTGDIESKAELNLLNKGVSLKSNILISPHHGSNTSSQYPFIKRVAAELVIHSTNRFNRFGFPKAKVVQRYQEMKYRQLSTGCSGMIEINLTSGYIKKMRQQRRIWRFETCSI